MLRENSVCPEAIEATFPRLNRLQDGRLDLRPHDHPDRRLNQLETAAALLLTAVAIIPHLIMLASAGALWRDEAVSVNLATLPTLSDIWRNLQSDSFPLAWPLLLRAWCAIVGSHNDQSLRLLGCGLGLTLLAVLWFNARSGLARVPLLGVALLGLHSAVLCYGDSLRGYGLGMTAGVLAIAMLWRAAQCNRTGAGLIGTWLIALLASLLCVHTLFHNAPLLLAACSAASAVLLAKGRWRIAALPLLLGLVCALSLMPYSLALGSSKEWVSIFRYAITPAWFGYKLRETFDDTGLAAMNLWLLIVCIAGLSPLLLASKFRQKLSLPQRELYLFSIITLIVGVGCHLMFLWVLSYYMQPWYFLTSLTIIAASSDGVFVPMGRSGRVLRLALALLLAIVCVPNLFNTARQQKTDVDQVARQIRDSGGSGDLVIVNNWWNVYSFRRQYTGPASCTSIPPIAFPPAPSVVRLTALKRMMEQPNDAMRSVLAQTEQTLRGHHRVWVVGDLTVPNAGEVLQPAAPYTDGSPAKDGYYYGSWTRELGQLIRDHGVSHTAVTVKTERPVSSYEHLPLYVLEGWKD
jgi:hypothetical protein